MASSPECEGKLLRYSSSSTPALKAWNLYVRQLYRKGLEASQRTYFYCRTPMFSIQYYKTEGKHGRLAFVGSSTISI